MSEENVEVSRQLFDAWSRRDVESAIDLLHEDIEWHPALTAGGVEGTVYRGAEGIRRWMAELDDVWAELSIELDEFREVGEDQVLQLGHFHAVGRESGVPVDHEQANLLAFKDGRITAARGYASHHEALEAAGLSE
jgi:ketosteroid isomerase-like protein